MSNHPKLPADPLLFVYGTLRSGSTHRMHQVLIAGSSFVGTATFQGRLYRVARYPGVVASRDAADQVAGEVYRLHDPARLLEQLDRYEGCNPVDPQAPYVRDWCRVVLDSGEPMRAWVYLYNRSTAQLPRLCSGDFMRERVPD